MGFWSGFAEAVAGIALVELGVLIEIGTLGGGTPLAVFLISSGAGLVLTGIGTMIEGNPIKGFATASKNPIQPWNGIYAKARVGGTLIYDHTFGDDDKWRDLVFVLACHPCEAVDELMFDQQRIQIGFDSTHTGVMRYSFSPLQQSIPVFDIARANNVVTVILHQNIPLLSDGDQVDIEGITGDLTLNGRWPVNIVSRVGSVLTFTYISGGLPSHVTGEGNCNTVWADYGTKVYMETLLGTQALGETFIGMTTGTWADGEAGELVTPESFGVTNPWKATCSAPGMTMVWLRLHYDDKIFANGLPQISFHVRGKNDIYDPRLGDVGDPGTTGYTENAALVAADFITNKVWGFKADYGTDVPIPQLIVAADVCDEPVDLEKGGTEPRYTANGGWTSNNVKGEILRNILTACAGRITDFGGEIIIWPGAWGLAEVFAGRDAGISASITDDSIYGLLTDAFEWKLLSVTDLYNGVKGTYISPANNWQSTDFPPYAQDSTHGFETDVYLDADRGIRRWLDIQLPFTISCPTAQRLAKIELKRRRQMGTGTFALNMAGFQFTPMDLIAMDLPVFAWEAKTLEVLKIRHTQTTQNNVPLQGIEIDVQETDESIFEWSIGEELSPAGYQQTITPSTRTPAPPTNVILRPGSNSILVTWTAPADGYVIHGGHIELEYQLVSSPEGLWQSLAKMDPTITRATIENLLTGQSYIVQLRSVNAAGIPSAWVVGTPVGTSGPGAIGIRTGPYSWNPGYEAPVAGDNMYSRQSFAMQPEYLVAADNSAIAEVQIWGNPPIAVPSKVAEPPELLTAVVFGTGGTIKAGTYIIGVSAYDGATPVARTALSDLVTVTVPLGTTNKIRLTVKWGAGSFGGQAYVAVDDTSRGLLSEAPFDVGISTGGSTVAYDLTSFSQFYIGAPDPNFDHIDFDVSAIIHGGSWGNVVDVVGVDTLTFNGQRFGVNEYVGTDISLVAFKDQAKRIIIANFAVASNTADTITVGPNAAGDSPPDLTTLFSPGDSFFMRIAPTAVSARGFVDTRLLNSTEVSYRATAGSWLSGQATLTIGAHGIIGGQMISVAGSDPAGYDSTDVIVSSVSGTTISYPVASDPGAWVGGSFLGGMLQHTESGNLAYILTGKGAGQTPKPIVDNSTISILLATDWDEEPDATSRIIILAPALVDTITTQPLEMSSYASFGGKVATLLAKNTARAGFLIQAYTVDQANIRCAEPVSRDLFLFGSGGNLFRGGITFSVDNTLAIGSDQAPHVFLAQGVTAAAVRFVVKQAPLGADLTFNLLLGGVVWMTLTIAAGTTNVAAADADVAAAVPIPANIVLTIDITSVGTTFPGSDLAGAIFF